jgi:DNA-binding transcriptional LysR family regulator
MGLEREFDIGLVVRTHSGVEATEAGMALFDETRAVSARYEQALQAYGSGSPCWNVSLDWPSAHHG